MKIQKIKLSDAALKENENGEFEMTYENEKTYPAALTNHALKFGKDEGLLNGSLIQDVFSLAKLERGQPQDIDDVHVLSIIYLAFVGMNPKSELTFEDFLARYHYSIEESFEIYGSITENMMNHGKNKFAEALKKSTANSKGK